MIHWIELENFSSFLESQRVDFTPGKAIDDLTVFESPAGVRLNKFCAIYGANAGGKTNLLKSIANVAKFIALSFRSGEDDPLPFPSHMFSDSKDARIALEFEVPRQSTGPSEDGNLCDVYRYEVVASTDRVLRESLRRKTSHLFSRVFERELEDDEYKITGLGERFASKLPRNVSFIAWLARHEVSLASTVRNYFDAYDGAQISGLGRMPGFFGTFNAVSFYRKNEHFMSTAIRMLQMWDFGIDDVKLIKKTYLNEGKEEEYWQAAVHHRDGEKRAILDMADESSGTSEMFAHLSKVLPVLQNGGVALIDEIEYGLHPHMVEALLNLFLREETNPKNAQLIFTTHADWIMDFLNKWQIVFVEKRDSSSNAWRLSEMKGVELRERYAQRYRSGAYGAVPRELTEECFTSSEH